MDMSITLLLSKDLPFSTSSMQSLGWSGCFVTELAQTISIPILSGFLGFTSRLDTSHSLSSLPHGCQVLREAHRLLLFL